MEIVPLPPSFLPCRCEFPAEMFWRREGASHHTHHLKVILETMKEQRRPRRTIREGRGRKERGREGAKSSQQPRPRRRKKLNRAAAAEKRAARSLPKIWQKSPTEAGGRRRGRGEGTGRIMVAAAAPTSRKKRCRCHRRCCCLYPSIHLSPSPFVRAQETEK